MTPRDAAPAPAPAPRAVLILPVPSLMGLSIVLPYWLAVWAVLHSIPYHAICLVQYTVSCDLFCTVYRIMRSVLYSIPYHAV